MTSLLFTDKLSFDIINLILIQFPKTLEGFNSGLHNDLTYLKIKKIFISRNNIEELNNEIVNLEEIIKLINLIIIKINELQININTKENNFNIQVKKTLSLIPSEMKVILNSANTKIQTLMSKCLTEFEESAEKDSINSAKPLSQYIIFSDIINMIQKKYDGIIMCLIKFTSIDDCLKKSIQNIISKENKENIDTIIIFMQEFRYIISGLKIIINKMEMFLQNMKEWNRNK